VSNQGSWILRYLPTSTILEDIACKTPTKSNVGKLGPKADKKSKLYETRGH